MNKRALSVCMLLVSVFMISGIAYAKVWLLPDYQESDLYSKRTVDPGTKKGDTITCSSYGGIAKASLGNGQVCSGAFSLANGTACCSSYTCSSEYKYNLNNCPTSKNLTLSGSTCVDASGTTWYTQCGCGSDYPATDDTCEHGVDKTSGSCTFDGKTYYGSCDDDPCSDEDNVMVCAAERCGHICGTNKCLKKECNTDCEAGWDAVAGNCRKVECPTLYATSLEGCAGYGLTLIDNSGLVLGTETNGSVSGTACRICTIDCQSGYADYNQFWCEKTPETACETLGYLQSTLKCGTGYKELFCPFDTTYSICIKTGSTTTTITCGSDELIGDKSAHSYGMSSITTGKACHKAVCKQTSTSSFVTEGIFQVYDLDDGGYVIASCKSDYKATTDSNGCITGCLQDGGTLTDQCAHDDCPSTATCTQVASGKYYWTSCPENYTTGSTLTGDYGTCRQCTEQDTYVCTYYTNLNKACLECNANVMYADSSDHACYKCVGSEVVTPARKVSCNNLTLN